MNESKNPQGTIPTDPTEYCCSSMTPRRMLAAKLRDLSLHVSDTDRCTLCKAADELDEPETSGLDWGFPLLALLLMGGFGGGNSIDPDGMKAYMDAVDKKRDTAPKI